MPSAQSTATPGGVLCKNLAWAFSGNAVFTLSQAAILPIVAKLGSVAMVGQYALGLAIVTPITLLTRLQLRAILVTDIRAEHGFPDYLGVRLCTNVLALAIVAVLVMAGGYPGETSAIIFLVALVKFLESASDLLFGLLQRYDRWDIISTSTVSKGLVSLLLLGSVMWQTGSLVAGLGAMAAWFAAVLVAYEVPFVRVFLSQRGKSARPTLRAGALWKLTRLALPMGLVATLLSIIPGFPFWPSWSVYDSRLPAAMQRFSHCCQVRYSFRCRSGLRMLADHGVPAKPEGPLATPLPRRPSVTRVRWLFRAVDVTLRAQVAPKSAAACRRTTSGSDAPPQAATNNIARASRAVRPSSSADAASSSATSF